MDRGRIVLITGVSSGIGAALATEFARRGDFVAGLARNGARLGALRKKILGHGGSCLMLSCDVREQDQVVAAIRKVQQNAGNIDVVVNNAGVTVFKDLAKTTTAEFDAIIDTNLRGTFLVTREILPRMVKRKGGTIINIISYAAKTTYTGSAAYSAAKAGTGAMMKVLREEVRKHGIRIINVYPGAVRTAMWSSKHRASMGDSMIPPEHLARLICEVSLQPDSLTTEEIVVRPPVGDLTV